MKTFCLPDLGEGLAEAEIREWYVKVGDHVTIDQPLVSMETAKAVVDVPSPHQGKITALHGKVNEMVKTGAPLITFEIEGMPKDKGSVVGKLETSEAKWDDTNAIIGSVNVKTASVKVQPLARALANQLQVNLSDVTPTGPGGLITTQDVKQFLASPSLPHTSTNKTAALSGQTETLHGARRTMAQVMLKSHQEVVPVTIVEDADITGLPANSDLTLHLLKAIAAGVKAEPALNAWFDGKTLERTLLTEVHIGLAMDTTEGLFVPVLKNVETNSGSQLRQSIDHYKQTVKARSIAAADLQGATITLSNFGTMAGRYATPIVVPPMVAILGCGRSRESVVIRQDKMQIGRLLPLSLTIDHRAVTGGEASRFLGTVVNYLRDVR